MAKRIERTDPHRPGAIVPADYRHVLCYSLPTTQDGFPMPSWRVNCELDRRREERDPLTGKTISVTEGKHDADGRCCVIGLRHIARVLFSEHGGTGQCSVCKAHFGNGEIWEHIPTGEHVHLGGTCAEKYEMVADRTTDEMMRDRERAAAATTILRAEKQEARTAFLSAHPGLADDLAVEHPIIADIRARFVRAAEISDKQIALVAKLANEVRNPAAVPVKVDAPTGRQTFRGVVVSTRCQESMYGTTLRMTIKITTPDGGEWIAWGTAPDALLSATCNHGGLKGSLIEVTATLERGREQGFAIMKRPRGKLIKPGCDPAKCAKCQSASVAA